METLKVRVKDFVENFEGPSWILVLLALTIAIPMSGGIIAFASFFIGASVGAMVFALLGLIGLTWQVYHFTYHFLKTLDQTYVAKPVHDEEG